MYFSYYGVYFSWQNIVIFMEILAFDMAIESFVQRIMNRQTNEPLNNEKNEV